MDWKCHAETGLPLFGEEKPYARAHRRQGQNLAVIVETPDLALVEKSVQLEALENVTRKCLIEAQFGVPIEAAVTAVEARAIGRIAKIELLRNCQRAACPLPVERGLDRPHIRQL